MVKIYLLPDTQREELKEYLEKRPRSMDQNMRALRHRCKQINFEQMRADLNLMEELVNIPMTRGRKPGSRKSSPAGFTVRAGTSVDQPASFNIKQENASASGFNIGSV